MAALRWNSIDFKLIFLLLNIYLKTLAFNNKKCIWESALCIKSHVLDSLFTFQICKLFSRRGKSFSSILVQFPHELSTTFVLIKNLHFVVKYVQEKLYFAKVGRKNSLILPRIIVYTLKHATRAIRFTFNSLAVNCSPIDPRSIDKFH